MCSYSVGKSTFGLLGSSACQPSKTLLEQSSSCQYNQIRTRYVDWRMIRDVKRRRMVKEYAPMRIRVNSLRKNTVLPAEIRVGCMVLCISKPCPCFAWLGFLLCVFLFMRLSVYLLTKYLKKYDQLHFWWWPSLRPMEETI